MEKKSKIPINETSNTTDPLEYPPTIEPLFWGTGEMLVWDLAQLVGSIDRDAVYNDLTEGAKNTASGLKEAFDLQAKQVAGNIVAAGTFGGARGFYSFFPVLTEGTSVVVLDPSDFHTEVLELSFSAEEKINGRPVADFFRPDGDLISFSTFSTGCGSPAGIMDDAPESAFSSKTVYSAFQKRIADLLETKISVEIRRALGIEADAGRSFPFNPENENIPEIYESLFELLSIEDRLGIVTTTAITHPNYPASVRYFIHHPAAE